MRTLVVLLALATGAVGFGPAAANAKSCVDLFGSCTPVWSGVCEYCDVLGVCDFGEAGGIQWCSASGVVCESSGWTDASGTCTPAN